jgi:hypothetical protein
MKKMVVISEMYGFSARRNIGKVSISLRCGIILK